MSQKSGTEEMITRYLLGDLSEKEKLQLEERYFADDEYYQKLLALEDELRYEYAQGCLSPRQRQQFEKRFLATSEDRQKTAFAQALSHKLAEMNVEPEMPAFQPAISSWWQSLLAYFSLRTPAVQFSLAAAAMLLLLGSSWMLLEMLRLRGNLEQIQAVRADKEQDLQQQIARQQTNLERLSMELERERNQRAQIELDLAQAKAAQQRARQQPSSPTFLSFILQPGLVRGVDGPKRLLISPGTKTLSLQLDLKRPSDHRSYRAELQTLDGAELWSQDLPRARSIGAGKAVVLRLPAQLIPAGDYVLMLKGRAASGKLEEIDEYYFTTLKQ